MRFRRRRRIAGRAGSRGQRRPLRRPAGGRGRAGRRRRPRCGATPPRSWAMAVLTAEVSPASSGSGTSDPTETPGLVGDGLLGLGGHARGLRCPDVAGDAVPRLRCGRPPAPGDQVGGGIGAGGRFRGDGSVTLAAHFAGSPPLPVHSHSLALISRRPPVAVRTCRDSPCRTASSAMAARTSGESAPQPSPDPRWRSSSRRRRLVPQRPPGRASTTRSVYPDRSSATPLRLQG